MSSVAFVDQGVIKPLASRIAAPLAVIPSPLAAMSRSNVSAFSSFSSRRVTQLSPSQIEIGLRSASATPISKRSNSSAEPVLFTSRKPLEMLVQSSLVIPTFAPEIPGEPEPYQSPQTPDTTEIEYPARMGAQSPKPDKSSFKK